MKEVFEQAAAAAEAKAAKSGISTGSDLIPIATRPVNELLLRRAPNAEQWATLNATVEGRLAVGVPWSRPCFTIFNENLVKADPSECAYVEANTFNSHCMVVLRCTPDEATSAITYGAGQQFSEVHQFADDNGLVMVGGADESVGAAGGWAQGGGHSALSPTFGLGVDRALEYKIMTPDGIYRVANACQNRGLFFALRGGGGGTFGVVLEASAMASPRVSMKVANINWNISDVNYEAVLKVFLENATTFAEQWWSGFVTPSLGNLVLINSKVNITEAEASVLALLDVTADMGAASTVTEVASYLEWFQDFVQGTAGVQDSIGVPIAISSRLIPQANHATPEARAQLLSVTLEANKYVSFSQIHFNTPYGFAGTGNGTSVTEARRNALWQVLLATTWAWNATLSEKQQAYALVGQAADLYRAITPGSGAYHNEADIHEPNHEISFWGTHYPELLKVKDKYDPDRILDCWHCVGWKGKSDPRFSCYI